jgi:hypothetical protein
VRKFGVESFARVRYFPVPMTCLNQLLRAKCNQHTDCDDAEFPEDGSPAVRRLKLQHSKH